MFERNKFLVKFLCALGYIISGVVLPVFMGMFMWMHFNKSIAIGIISFVLTLLAVVPILIPAGGKEDSVMDRVRSLVD